MPGAPDAVVRLRGHHLLCMLAYVGYGYTPEFTKAFDNAVTLINDGVPVEIVPDVDDLCGTLDPDTQEDYHCNDERSRQQDAVALQALNDTLSTDWAIGSRVAITPDIVELMRAAFKTKTVRKGCVGCPWYDTCTEIADRRFEGTKLHVEG